MTLPTPLPAQVLSALTEDDSAFLKSLALQSPESAQSDIGFLTVAATGTEAASKSGSSATPAPRAMEGRLDEALRIAALLGAFDPLRLVPDIEEADLQRLLLECNVSTDGITSRWSLRGSSRQQVLARMAAEPTGLARGVEGARTYLQRSGESADEVTQTLIGIAVGKPPRQQDFAAMSKESLAASRAAIGWLQDIDSQFGFDANGLLGAIELAELLEPFRFLTGFDPETGRDTFVGRQDELRQLRSFVDALRSQGLVETVQRSGRRWVSSDRRVLGFSGVGGIGKSTLLSKFILQHVAASDSPSLRFAYLDFDRSTVSAVQPATLLLELVRQVGWQAPVVRQDLEALRGRIREEMERNRFTAEDGRRPRSPGQSASGSWPEPALLAEPGPPEELIGPSLLNSYLHEAGQILARGRADDRPLLLVLDTFEEAQALGDQAVRRVEEFVRACQDQLPRLRAVIVGRDEVADFFDGAERLVITEFKDLASRTAFLEKRGLDKALAKTVAKQVGGRPLALLLVARLVKEQGLDSISVSLTDRFRGLFNKYLIDGILYQRILQHIGDDDVKALAHPGLVLRRIDAEVLMQVVAPVLGMGEISAKRAAGIVSALRLQKDLVRSEIDGSVTHRPDVREQMLVLMGLEKPDLVKALHTAAADYYARRQTRPAQPEELERFRTEEIYHRLSIGDSLDRMPELWFPRARLGLARSVDELQDVAGRGTLKVLLGRMPTPEELAALPGRVLREYTTRALTVALQLPDPDRALAVLAEFEEHVDPALRRSIEPRVLDLAGLWASARRLFVKLVDKPGAELAVANALAAADFFERIPGRERYRDEMQGLLLDLHLRQAQSGKNRSGSNRLLVAALRLRVRQGRYGNGRPSMKELELDEVQTFLAGSETFTAELQWLLTLTNELDLIGSRLIESLPVTDTVRGQLGYLQSLLREEATHSEEAAIGIKVCEVLAQSRTLGLQGQRQFSGPAEHRVLTCVLRHLVRPQTPQWYVPLACLIRKQFGESVNSADLYGASLPELPFRAAPTIRTVRALADYLGRLDQLGVLHSCLGSRLAGASGPDGPGAGVSVQAFLEWRQAMLFDIDGWFASFDRIRRLSMDSRAS